MNARQEPIIQHTYRRMRLLALTAALLAVAACASGSPRAPATPAQAGPRPIPYGRLQILNGRLCGSDGKPVQLRGMSTAGLQWYSEIVNDKAFTALAQDWKANLVRLTMYVGEGGYASHPELMQHLQKGIDLAIAHGMYVIVNWAVHIPGNPNDDTYRGAQDFFDQISRKYGKHPNLLYEIMSEPNGAVDWAKDLKPYAEKTVATIRRNDPDGIILIGSGMWSQDVDMAAADPVAGHNLAYTFHFYAGTHGEPQLAKVRGALAAGVAVFASEWGTSECKGFIGPYLPESTAFLAFLDAHGISWANWSMSDKHEASAALKSIDMFMQEGRTEMADRESLLVPAAPGPEGYPIWRLDELSPSGVFIRNRLRDQAAAEEKRR
jgi:endoglucanase